MYEVFVMARRVKVFLRNGRYIYTDEPKYKNGHVYVDTSFSDYFTFKDREWVFGSWVYKIEWQSTKQTAIVTEREMDDRIQLGFAKLYHRPRAGKGGKKKMDNNMLEGDLFRL